MDRHGRCVLLAIAGLVLLTAATTDARAASGAGHRRPAAFAPVDVPSRLVDTRPGAATVDGRLAGIGVRPAAATLKIPVVGRAGIGTGVATVAVNVTVDAAAEQGFLTVHSCDADRPVASNLNYTPGATVAALALSRVADDGSICVFNHGATHLIVDVVGGFAAGDVAALPAPLRLLDTRPASSTVDGAFARTGVRPSGETLRLPVAGRAGVPADARSVVLSVTADAAREPGFVAVHACDLPRPNASTLNYSAGETIANAAVTRLGADGDVCLHTAGATDLLVDVTGWFVGDSAAVLLDGPRRVVDTRAGTSTIDGQFRGIGVRPAGAALELVVAGRAGVPADAGAVLLNVTVDAARQPGFVTLFPGGADRPTASNLNYAVGDTIANAAITRVGANGDVCVFTSGAADLVVDVVGWLPGPAPVSGSGCPSQPLFPSRRLVAMYGNDVSAQLGVLGEQPPAAAAQRLAGLVEPFRAGDRPVQGAFELIATIATSFPGTDGLYRSPSTAEHVQRYLDVALANDLYLILDIQPGRSDFLTELRRYEAFLRLPNVGVALDPEWRVGPGQVPGQVVGQVGAAEVNAVADYVAGIVAQENLPDKLLVVHQFQERMITDRHLLREPPGVVSTIHMDGFGTQSQKLTTYRFVHADPPFSNGFKLFFDEDVDMFSPAEVLALDPVPDLVTYQ
jgi:hypothetical protein